MYPPVAEAWGQGAGPAWAPAGGDGRGRPGRGRGGRADPPAGAPPPPRWRGRPPPGPAGPRAPAPRGAGGVAGDPTARQPGVHQRHPEGAGHLGRRPARRDQQPVRRRRAERQPGRGQPGPDAVDGRRRRAEGGGEPSRGQVVVEPGGTRRRDGGHERRQPGRVARRQGHVGGDRRRTVRGPDHGGAPGQAGGAGHPLGRRARPARQAGGGSGRGDGRHDQGSQQDEGPEPRPGRAPSRPRHGQTVWPSSARGVRRRGEDGGVLSALGAPGARPPPPRARDRSARSSGGRPPRPGGTAGRPRRRAGRGGRRYPSPWPMRSALR